MMLTREARFELALLLKAFVRMIEEEAERLNQSENYHREAERRAALDFSDLLKNMRMV
jgi:hypothetical protein